MKPHSPGAASTLMPALGATPWIWHLLGLFCALPVAAPATRLAAAEVVPPRPPAITVCADGGAGGYEAFPDVCRLPDGRLMVVFYAGYDHVSLPKPEHPRGGRIDAVFSADHGASWSPPEVVFDGPHDDRDPSVTALQDGRLLCVFFSLEAATNAPGYKGAGTWLIESADLGRTWSTPRLVADRYYGSSPVRELPSGQLILGLYREENNLSAGAVIRSADAGKTWGPVVDIDPGGRKLDAETDVIALKDGGLFAVQRASQGPMCFAVSTNSGDNWSVSEPLGFPGHAPYLLRAADGVLLLAHRLPGTALHFSRDEGRTWERGEQVDTCIGAYPSMANLQDGSVLIVYYEEGAGSNLRARRFRVAEDGVRWLPLPAAAGNPGTAVQAGWNGPEAGVGNWGGAWRIRGRRTQVALHQADLKLTVETGSRWNFEASAPGDLRVRDAGKNLTLRLAEAQVRSFRECDTGARRGFEIELGGFRGAQGLLEVRVRLALGLEGPDEELVAELGVLQGADKVVECQWPAALAPESCDATVVPFMQGMLLPKAWPRKVWLYDTMTFGRGLYQPWWGYQQGSAALLLVLETPEDAGCVFEHPAGGPTHMGVRWVHSLGRFDEPRRARFCWLPEGNYVGLAKRYRRHVQGTGNFVSLAEKIARNPRVQRLVGSPVVHTSILYHIQPESSYYHKDDPAKNDELVSFASRAESLRGLAARGVAQAYVHLDGWGYRGYDNLHPDVLPPSPAAGGWDGFRLLADTCDRLGYVFAIHDQYRDYYLDARSYDPRSALLEENGKHSEHSTWYGGRQTILCPSLAPAHVRKNHDQIRAHGVKLMGAYLDVFSVVPPEECYAPGHPVSRRACLQARTEALASVRSWGGVVSSEEPSGWSLPVLDLVHHGPYPLDPNPGKGPSLGIPVPLFNLVYHDALFIPWSLDRGAWGIPEKDLGFLHGLGNAGLPYLGLEPDDRQLEQVRTMAALHARVGLLELVRHEFLDATWRRQRFTYADGTGVTIDLDADTWQVEPPLGPTAPVAR